MQSPICLQYLEQSRLASSECFSFNKKNDWFYYLHCHDLNRKVGTQRTCGRFRWLCFIFEYVWNLLDWNVAPFKLKIINIMVWDQSQTVNVYLNAKCWMNTSITRTTSNSHKLHWKHNKHTHFSRRLTFGAHAAPIFIIQFYHLRMFAHTRARAVHWVHFFVGLVRYPNTHTHTAQSSVRRQWANIVDIWCFFFVGFSASSQTNLRFARKTNFNFFFIIESGRKSVTPRLKL